MSDKCIDTIGLPASSAPMSWGGWLKFGLDKAAEDTVQLTKLVMMWMERNRNRRELSKLDDRILKDVGLNRADLEDEIQKPFWKS